MLTKEENELLTRVGPGTPMGDLMRRFWQPAALSEELPTGGAPLSIRLLGEDLVLFRPDLSGRPDASGRDERGQLGLLDLYCSHRGVDLSYGRVEDGGLRCLYHGWLYDVAGRCLEQPAEPPGSEYHTRIRHLAYPCKELARVIFAYLGPGEPPIFPMYEPFTVDDEHRAWRKVYEDCNYLQSLEGGIDPSHTSFLHRQFRRSDYEDRGSGRGASAGAGGVPTITDPRAGPVAPTLEVEETDSGTRQFALRRLASGVFLRASSFILPNVNVVSAGSTEKGGYHMGWHVPIDDTHSCRYAVDFTRHEPLDKEGHEQWLEREIGPGYRPFRTAGNRYLQDREEMKTVSYSGLGQYVPIHDIAIVELQRPILDRTREHLGYSDKSMASARRGLLAAVSALEHGREPAHVLRDGHGEIALPLGFSALVPESEDWRAVAERLLAEERGWASRALATL